MVAAVASCHVCLGEAVVGCWEGCGCGGGHGLSGGEFRYVIFAISSSQALIGVYATGPYSALSFEDADALAAVLPGGQLFDSTFGFYLHVSSLFKSASLIDHDVHFARLAISNAPPEWDTNDLWSTVIRGATDLGYWDEAYAALMATPHDIL